MSSPVETECVCTICLGSDPPPIQSGCACRSDSGLAHLECLVEKAVAQRAHRFFKAWWECQTCGQRFTGEMRRGLGEAWWSRVCAQAEESTDRLGAAHNLAACRRLDGEYADAERIDREVLGSRRRVLGEEHPDTLLSANNLASSLLNQGKHADAERIGREVLGSRRRVLGEEHPDTLMSAGNLAQSLSRQGKHADAERINREVLGARRRVLGEEHPDTLTGAANLAMILEQQAKFSEAEEMLQATLEASRRVLGNTHPETLTSANNLAMSLFNQGKYAEAERMLHVTLASLRRVLGPAHPNTLHVARGLEGVRARIRASPPTNAVAPAAADAARLLPAGTHVLVQRLVAKPEHNGKRARVLSFDARTGRYAVALDDGKELSLKAECVARAGCAAAGCASEEASSMCSRCQAVRYCSRECQRTDWKAHKPVCTAAQP
jgi:tetratricopeptide (TPR) repeat protein